MSIRASVLTEDGAWLGYTDITGALTEYGLPLHWWDGSAWQKVARLADGDSHNGYDDVFVWTGVTWVPWSSARYASVGTVWQGADASAPGAAVLTHTFSYPTGHPVVIAVGYGSAWGPVPSDTAQATGQPYASPSFPTHAGAYGNGSASSFGCSPGWESAAVTQPADPVDIWTSIRQSDDPTAAVTTWRFPNAPDDRFDTGAAYIAVPLGLVGVDRVAEFFTSNCYLEGGSDTVNRYFPGLTGAAPVDGLLIRAMAVFDQGAPATGTPDVIPTPAGHTLLWQGTQATSGNVSSSLGLTHVRLAVFSMSVPAGTTVTDTEVALGTSTANGETVAMSMLFI